MGKAIINTALDESAKEAIVQSAKLVIGEERSMTKFLETIGSQLQEQMDFLEMEYGTDIPPLKMTITLAVKPESAATITP